MTLILPQLPALLVEHGDLLLLIKPQFEVGAANICLLYTSPSPRDRTRSRMPSSA